MTQCNTLNVKLSYSQLNKLKSGIKDGTEVTFNFHLLLLLVILMMRIIFKKSKTHIIGQSEGFSRRLLGSLLKAGLPLMKNVLTPLAKSVLIPLGLTAAASATDAAIQREIFGSGMTTLIISSDVMNIMKIVKSLEESGLLIKGVNESIKNEANKQKGRFLGMLLGTLGASL